jgi:DNA processing protein
VTREEHVRIDPGDAGYPTLLASLAPAPPIWIRGRLAPEDALGVAIVGARRATAYGLGVAERLAFDLAARGVTIISGLARGIDSAAHRGALAAKGRTVAVLGCGVDVVYPPENRRLVDDIIASGAVLSQFPPGTPPLSHHFPVRNRTLAGLALAVVVVEAGERSGALITAGDAGDLGREVLVVPGAITAETSRGTNGLIRDGATLVRDWADIVQELPVPWRHLVSAPVTSDESAERPPADSVEARVLGLLSTDVPQHIEALIARSGCAPARIAAALVALELGGWARQLEGQRWTAVTVNVRRT